MKKYNDHIIIDEMFIKPELVLVVIDKYAIARCGHLCKHDTKKCCSCRCTSKFCQICKLR